VNSPVLTLASRICGALLFVCSASGSRAATEPAERHPLVQDQVDWAAFLARHDLVWDRPGKNYFEAPLVGNGLVGAMIWQDSDNTLRLSVGRTDVTDHLFDGAAISDAVVRPIATDSAAHNPYGLRLAK
jgi:hypothetical protein